MTMEVPIFAPPTAVTVISPSDLRITHTKYCSMQQTLIRISSCHAKVSFNVSFCVL
jgi:hypothetical protein